MKLDESLVKKIGKLSQETSNSAEMIIEQEEKRKKLEKEKGYKLGILKSFILRNELSTESTLTQSTFHPKKDFSERVLNYKDLYENIQGKSI